MEVGASGRRYSRAFVLETLAHRLRQADEGSSQLQAVHCQDISADSFLVTYTLRNVQKQHTVRRS
jgi:hypothetical protein